MQQQPIQPTTITIAPLPTPPAPSSLPISRPKKNTYRFNLGNSTSTRQILITSNFDSGNIELIRQISETHYRLAAVPDISNQARAKKTWFYFKVRAPKYVKLRLVIENVEILSGGYQAELPSAKPYYKIGEQGQWTLLTDCHITHRQQLQLQIQHTFTSDDAVYYCLTIPFSYLQNHDYLQSLQNKTPSHVYFHKEILTYSANQLIVNLLTISQQVPDYTSAKQELIDEAMFPDSNRPVRINKPVVLVTCRVHPGEVSASHALTGMLDFLCLSEDPRAYLLRRLFVFMIIPMVNPDGVYQGNYRMDSLSTNLNRVYNNPSPQLHPTISAIKLLAHHLTLTHRLSFFFDMHGHSSSKCSFIYGNAWDDIIPQVETQVFCKVLQLNSKHFQYGACNFEERHMRMRDRSQPLSKEGCARVVFGRMTGVVHCLTLETGLFLGEREKGGEEVPEITNTNLQIKHHKLQPRKPHNNKSPLLDMYHQLGQSLLITILDVTEKNPYSRIPNSQLKSLDSIRKSLATAIFQSQQRFKMLDLKAYQKTKSISKHIQQVFTDKIEAMWNFKLYEDLGFFEWPQGVEGFRIFRRQKQLSVKRSYKKAVENVPLVLAEDTNIGELEKALTQTASEDKRKKLFIKSLSPVSREATRSMPFEEPRLIKLEQVGLLQKGEFGKHKSTRKLLRDFEQVKNEMEIVKTQPADNHHRSKANAIQTISQQTNLLFCDDNKFQAKLLNRTRNTFAKARIKTQSSNPLLQPTASIPSNPLIIKSNSKSCLKQPPQSQPDILETRLKKIRNAKRQIINAKFSQIRKKSQKGNLFRLPEIRKLRYELCNFDREEFVGSETVSVSVLQIDTVKVATSKNIRR